MAGRLRSLRDRHRLPSKWLRKIPKTCSLYPTFPGPAGAFVSVAGLLAGVWAGRFTPGRFYRYNSSVGRRLFNFAAVLSLVLCGLITAARIRLHYTSDCLFWASGGRCVIVEAYEDKLSWWEYTNWPTTEPLTWQRGRGYLGPAIFGDSKFFVLVTSDGHLASAPPRTRRGQWLTPRDSHWQPISGPVIYSFSFSRWIVITALMPAVWVCVAILAAVDRNSDRRRGCCRACGYSLTGNTSGMCPECGTKIENQRPENAK